MKRTPIVVMMGLALGFGTLTAMSVRADDEKPAATKPAHAPGLRGKISKVDGDKITVKAHDGTETEVTTDSETKFTLDGQPATLQDAKEGLFVNVRPTEGVAKRVQMSTKPPQRKKPAGSDNSNSGNSSSSGNSKPSDSK